MPRLMKKANYQSEEEFHNQWAYSTPIEDIDPIAFFEGPTSPEYKQCLKYIGPVKGKKILILGCGLGEEAVYLAINEAKITAIDLSEGMIEIARKVSKRYKV